MINYTDALIDTPLTEAYNSKAASDEQSRQAAEKAFLAELTNGPAKWITTSTGKSFKKAIGTFDLDKFHEAYDAYFDAENLLGLFDQNGKLTNRGTYGQIKDLNKLNPAVKALLQLWAVQFKNEMEFTADKYARQQAQVQAAQAAQKAAAEKARKDAELLNFKNIVAQKTQELVKYIKSLKEYKQLEHYYDPNIELVEVSAPIHTSDDPDTFDLSIRIIPNISTTRNAYSKGMGKAVWTTIKHDDIVKDWLRLPEVLAACDDICKMFVQNISVKVAVDMLTTNYNSFVQKWTSHNHYTSDAERETSRVYIWDSKSQTMYYAKFISILTGANVAKMGSSSGTPNALVLVDCQTNKATSNTFTNAFDFAACFVDGYHCDTNRGWHEHHHKIHFNSKFKTQLEANKVDLSEYNKAIGYTDTAEIVPETDKNWIQSFDKVLIRDYECDSGD